MGLKASSFHTDPCILMCNENNTTSTYTNDLFIDADNEAKSI